MRAILIVVALAFVAGGAWAQAEPDVGPFEQPEPNVGPAEEPGTAEPDVGPFEEAEPDVGPAEQPEEAVGPEEGLSAGWILFWIVVLVVIVALVAWAWTRRGRVGVEERRRT